MRPVARIIISITKLRWCMSAGDVVIYFFLPAPYDFIQPTAPDGVNKVAIGSKKGQKCYQWNFFAPHRAHLTSRQVDKKSIISAEHSSARQLRSGCALRTIAERRSEARAASKSSVGSVKRGPHGAAKQSGAE